MYLFLTRAAAVTVTVLSASFAQAATFNQSGFGPAGTAFAVDVDLAPFSGVLLGFSLQFDPDDSIYFTGIVDNPIEGDANPIYDVFADSGAGYEFVGTNSGSGANFVGISPFNGLIGVLGTSAAVPFDNLSKLQLVFAAIPGTLDGLYAVNYALSFTLDLGTSGVTEDAFAVGGTFAFRVGDEPITPTSPIPLPAGAVLMLSALGALGAARSVRRKG